MASIITQCENCKVDERTLEFPILNPEVLKEASIIVTVNTKCPKCGYEFSFGTLSDRGKDKRNRGFILV